MRKKIIGAAAVLIAVGGFILGYFIFAKSKALAPTNPSPNALKDKTNNVQNETTPVAADLGEPAESVSGIMAGLETQFLTEDRKVSAEDNDAGAIIDQSALDDLGQSYDENEF